MQIKTKAAATTAIAKTTKSVTTASKLVRLNSRKVLRRPEITLVFAYEEEFVSKPNALFQCHVGNSIAWLLGHGDKGEKTMGVGLEDALRWYCQAESWASFHSSTTGSILPLIEEATRQLERYAAEWRENQKGGAE